MSQVPQKTRIGDAGTPIRCLAIEAATGTGSIAVADGKQVHVYQFPANATQSRQIYGGIRTLLDQAGLRLRDLDGIAFGCGPGTFTGLRVAAAAAQSLAFGANLPVMRVSSLAALAAGARRHSAQSLIAASLDARMGQAYLGVYAFDDERDPQAMVPDCLVSPGSFRLPGEEKFLAAGPGWSACPELVDNHAGLIAARDFARVPSAREVVLIAARMFAAGQTIRAEQALPNYVRDKVTD